MMIGLGLGLALALLLTAGCTVRSYCHRACAWISIPSESPPAIAKPAAEPAEPAKPTETAVPGWWSDAPKPSAPGKPSGAPNDRAQKIAAARGDLKTGLTALELRAVTACTEPGEACVENEGLMTRARTLDKQLAAALLDPQLAVNWDEVTTVLRAVVDTAMKGAPK